MADWNHPLFRAQHRAHGLKCPRKNCACTTHEAWHAAQIAPGMACRVAHRADHVRPFTWSVGGPVLWSNPLSVGDVVHVVGWSCTSKVDDRFDAVVVLCRLDGKLTFRSMFAWHLDPV